MNLFSGVYVAIVTPFDEKLNVDVSRLGEHVDWLIREGVDGIVPTGSVGEYATLSAEERRTVVETAIAAAAGRVPVIVGTAAASTGMAVQWAEHAKQAGASGIMALPPISYRPSEAEVVHHYESLSMVGLPIVVYNNPHDYPTDMKPAFLQQLSTIENVVAVKEFSGDIRRVHDIQRLTDLQIMIGVDDLAMEGGLFGVTGWIAGLTNVLPSESVRMFKLAQQGQLEEAIAIYRRLLPLFHWDANPRLVQAIKFSMELAGRPMGLTRPPRLPLTEAEQSDIREAYAYATSE